MGFITASRIKRPWKVFEPGERLVRVAKGKSVK
jgi:hypothetical protein